MFTCKLEYPPTINHYYGYNKHTGKKHLLKNAKDYMQRQKIIIERHINNIDFKIIQTNVDIYIYVYAPDLRIRDKDNIQKCIFDTLQLAGVVANDNLIQNIYLHPQPFKTGFECVVISLLPHSPILLDDDIYHYYFGI
jgi:crossover junction endodeoxyribonuclease RusA